MAQAGILCMGHEKKLCLGGRGIDTFKIQELVAGYSCIVHQDSFLVTGRFQLCRPADDHFARKVFLVCLMMMAMGFVYRLSMLSRTDIDRFGILCCYISQVMPAAVIIYRCGTSYRIQAEDLKHDKQQQQIRNSFQETAHAKGFIKGAKVYFLY